MELFFGLMLLAVAIFVSVKYKPHASDGMTRDLMAKRQAALLKLRAGARLTEEDKAILHGARLARAIS